MSVINGLSSGGNSAFSTTVDVAAGAGADLLPPPPYCLRPVLLFNVPEPPTDLNSLASYELICASSVSPSSP